MSTSTPPSASPSPPRPVGANFFAWIRSLGVTRRDDAWIGGVCAGVAARTGLDPLLVRGIAIVIAILGGPIFLAYAVGWALLPDSRGHIHAESAVHGEFTYPMIFIGIGAVLTFLPFTRGIWFDGAPHIWGMPDWLEITLRTLWVLALIGGAIWLTVAIARRVPRQPGSGWPGNGGPGNGGPGAPTPGSDPTAGANPAAGAYPPAGGYTPTGATSSTTPTNFATSAPATDAAPTSSTTAPDAGTADSGTAAYGSPSTYSDPHTHYTAATSATAFPATSPHPHADPAATAAGPAAAGASAAGPSAAGSAASGSAAWTSHAAWTTHDWNRERHEQAREAARARTAAWHAAHPQPQGAGAAFSSIVLGIALVLAAVVGISYGAVVPDGKLVLVISIAALAVISVGIVIAGVRGRASGGLGPFAFLLALVVVFTGVLPAGTQVQPFGTQNIDVSEAVSGGPDSYLLIAGKTVVDAADLTAKSPGGIVDVWLAAGQAEVIVPDGVAFRVESHILGGTVTSPLGTERGGAFVDDNRLFTASGSPAGIPADSESGHVTQSSVTALPVIRVWMLGGNVRLVPESER